MSEGIKNPFAGGVTKIKKVPPKVWMVAGGGGVVIYLVYRGHTSNQTPDPTVTDTTDAGALQGSPVPGDGGAGTLPGVYPVGAGQGALPDMSGAYPLPAVDFSGVDAASGSDGTTGVGAADAATPTGSGVQTLNIVVKTDPIRGKTTHKAAPKKNRHAKAKPKGAGGAPRKRHPSSTHGAPKHPIKRSSPPSHIQNAPHSHTPAKAPEPAHRPKTKTRAKPKRQSKTHKPTVKRRLFAHPNRPNNRKVKH